MKTFANIVLIFFSFQVFAVLPADYQSRTAAAKLDVLWQKISAEPYTTLPEMVFFPSDSYKAVHGYKMVRDAATLGKAFDHVGDEMPGSRVKIIHSFGSAAQIEFVPSAQSPHPFTGLFKSGAVGVARLSLGMPFHSTKSFVPGMGIKFLVNGHASKNMHVMQRLEGQGDNTNIFKHTFTNKLPDPAEAKTKLGAKYFARFVQNPIFLKVDHVASISADGSAVDAPKAPYQIFFQPADGLALDEKAPDFRVELAKLSEGTKLYDVFGTLNEHVKTPIYIGSVYLRSTFVASEYSDRVLYFQHEGTPRRSFWWGREIKSAKP